MKTLNFVSNNEQDNSKDGNENKGDSLQLDDSTIDEITESINAIDFETPEKIARKKVAEIQKGKEDRTPKTGKKSAKALKSEEKEKLLGVTRSFVEGINSVLVDRIGEDFNHEKEELDTYSVLLFALVQKYFPDLSDWEYAEESALLMYMFGQETPRIMNYLEKKKQNQGG